MSSPLNEHLGAFRCPKCGNDGTLGALRFLEDITCYRPILGVKGGVLEIDGLYRTDGYDDGTTGSSPSASTSGRCRPGSASTSTGSDPGGAATLASPPPPSGRLDEAVGRWLAGPASPRARPNAVPGRPGTGRGA